MPLAIWASPTFIANRKSEWTSLRAAASKAATSKSVTHDFFFHTVLGCSGVRSTLLRSDLNLCVGDIFRGASELPVEAPGQPRAIASTDHLVRIGSGVSSRCGMAFSDYVRRHEATLSRRGSDCEKEFRGPWIPVQLDEHATPIQQSDRRHVAARRSQSLVTFKLRV